MVKTLAAKTLRAIEAIGMKKLAVDEYGPRTDHLPVFSSQVVVKKADTLDNSALEPFRNFQPV